MQAQALRTETTQVGVTLGKLCIRSNLSLGYSDCATKFTVNTNFAKSRFRMYHLLTVGSRVDSPNLLTEFHAEIFCLRITSQKVGTVNIAIISD